MSSRTYLAAFAATTILAGTGAAVAANGPAGAPSATTPPPGHAAAVKDFSKLSADGVRAYQDLTLARLAIFDGRVGDAKKYVADADAGFNKAKTDESVFTQAEANMRSHTAKSGQGANGSAGASSGAGPADGSSQAVQGEANASDGNDVHKPIAWLPVDGTVSINEDFSLKPAKVKAVKDANESLAKGDRKGAMDKLKLADVDTTVTLAVVPLQQTLKDVDAAKQLIDGSKYYEGSQKLRAVQDATLFTVAMIPSVPVQGKAAAGDQPAPQVSGSGAGH